MFWTQTTNKHLICGSRSTVKNHNFTWLHLSYSSWRRWTWHSASFYGRCMLLSHPTSVLDKHAGPGGATMCGNGLCDHKLLEWSLRDLLPNVWALISYRLTTSTTQLYKWQAGFFLAMQLPGHVFWFRSEEGNSILVIYYQNASRSCRLCHLLHL